MMKNLKIKLILSSISLVVSLFLVVGSTIAWFVSNSSVNNFKFQVLQIDSQVNVYVGKDSNNNGVIDLLDDDNIGKYKDSEDENSGYSDYTRAYYEEKHEFVLYDSKYALSINTTANLLNTIILENVLPSKIFTFKFEITNYSALSNTLDFTFLDKSLTQSEMKALSCFNMKIGEVNSLGNITYNNDEWVSIVNYVESSNTYSYSEISILNDVEVTPAGAGIGEGRKDLWLQIKMKENATISDIDNAKKVVFPNFKIELTALVEED